MVFHRSILETKLAVGGKSIIEHNEVLGLDAALKYINQTLVDRPQGHIFLKDLLEIHKRVIGYVDPTEAGFFRETQVFVGMKTRSRIFFTSDTNSYLRLHVCR